MSGIVWYLGAFLLAIGILVVFHEFGHYLAARYCGVKVLRFCVGFGRIIWSRRAGKDGTEWAVAAFPLGGYVKMLDEREAPVPEAEQHRTFNRKSVGARALIVAAGPVANFLLAIFFYWVMFIYGVDELRPRLAAPVVGSPAAISGLTAGDEIRAVNGVAVRTWGEVRWELVRHVLDRRVIDIEVGDDSSTRSRHRLDLSAVSLDDLESDPLRVIGLRLHRPPVPAVVGQVMPESAAAQAGLRVDDRITMIDGESVEDWAQVSAAARNHPDEPMVLVIERGNQVLNLIAVPEAVDEGKARIGRLGVRARTVADLESARFIRISHDPLTALVKSVAQTWDTSIFSLKMLGRMLVGELSWKNLSGPVTIADYAGQSASLGLVHYIRFLALVSISLGVLNLLPIPVLDGGHLLYYFAEFIKGGPLPDRFMEIGQQVGFLLLAVLMGFALYNDLLRIVSG